MVLKLDHSVHRRPKRISQSPDECQTRACLMMSITRLEQEHKKHKVLVITVFDAIAGCERFHGRDFFSSFFLGHIPSRLSLVVSVVSSSSSSDCVRLNLRLFEWFRFKLLDLI